MPYKKTDNIQAMLDELHELQTEMEAHETELDRLQRRQYAIKGEIAALEIPPLKAEMEGNNEKIAYLEKRKRYYEIDLKIREAQKKELLRKQRNRRIFTRGGMLEAFLIEPLLLSDEDVHDFLEKVFRMPEVDSLLRKLIDDACTLEDDESEKDAEDEENGGPFVEGRNYTP